MGQAIVSGMRSISSRARFSGQKQAPTPRARSSPPLASAGAPEQSLLAACYLYLIPLCSLVRKFLRLA